MTAEGKRAARVAKLEALVAERRAELEKVLQQHKDHPTFHKTGPVNG